MLSSPGSAFPAGPGRRRCRPFGDRSRGVAQATVARGGLSLIDWEDVVVSAPRRRGTTLGPLTLHVDRAGCTVLGPGGAGKSALLRLAATLDRPARGQVRVNGRDPRSMPFAVRGEIGYVGPEIDLPGELTLEEFLTLVARVDGHVPGPARRIAEETAAQVHLERVLSRELRHFSGGMKRRTLLAQALMRRPSVLLVDDPTAGLDPAEQLTVLDLLRQSARTATVAVATGNVEDAQALGFPVAVLDQGTLVRTASPDRLAEAAAGHVVIVPGTVREAWSGDLRGGLSRPVRDRDGTWGLRLLVESTASWEREGGRVVREPTLEDGYLFALWQSRRARRTA